MSEPTTLYKLIKLVAYAYRLKFTDNALTVNKNNSLTHFLQAIKS